MKRRFAMTVLATLAGVCAAVPIMAEAQPLSDRPIRIIVVGTPGATADILGRTVGEALSRSLKQPVLVDPKPGAGGNVAMDAFLKAPADGHTFLLSISSLVSELPYTFKPKYDPFTALKPLVDLGGFGVVLVGNVKLPPRNLEEMISYVKAHKGQINIASYSPGTMSHVLGLQLNKLAGLDMNIVQYNGSTPGLVDVIGGNVQFMMDTPVTSIPMVKSGKLRAFATGSAQRLEALPDVPTFAELGYESMSRISWMGLWTLPGVKDEIQQRIRSETLKALAQPGVLERLTGLGLTVNVKKPRTPEELSASLAADYKSTGELLRSVNYKP
ncbi:Bug family tripartite tricarboxylate transporter substrate binding protein [Ottowia sp. VDI28]|uniref:Bug family tripartite tricarboxylate transporter substrate binding protein n=1 Tax=Ottowia sp. VDI28 TaxID=3133968 RepID=UPI003C2CB7FF